MGYLYIKNNWIDYNKDIPIDDQRNAIVTVGKLNKMESGIALPTIEYVNSPAKYGNNTNININDDIENGNRSIDITFRSTINNNTPNSISTYSAQYIKDVFNTANNISNILNQASGNYSTLADRLNAIEEKILDNKYKKYGVRWTGLSGSRTYNAANLIVNIGTDKNDAYNDFDRIYPWRDIRKCKGYPNITNTFTVTSYSNDHKYKNDNNNVWVEIPKFYYYRSEAETIISEYKINDNYILPSKFRLNNGEELDKVYIAVYKLSYLDNTPLSKPNTPPITTENTADYRLAYFNDSQQFSNIMDKSWGVIYKICTNYGLQYSGFTLEDYEIIYILATVEFATKDLSSIMKGAINVDTTEEKILSDFGNVLYMVDRNQIIMDKESVTEFFKLSNGLVEQLCNNNEKYFTIRMNIKDITEIENDDDTKEILENNNIFYRTITNYEIIDDRYIFTFSENINDMVPLDGCVSFKYETMEDDDIEAIFNFNSSISISLDVYSNGCTDNIITPSGSLINNTSGYYPCRYRYIENPWGNQRDAIYQIKASMDNDKLSYIYNKNISEDLLDETNNIIYNTDISENGTYGMSYNNSPFILPISSGNDSNITIDSVNIDTNKALPIYIGVDVNYKNNLSGFTIINIGNLPNTTNNDNINNSISSRLSYITK